jgi:hypothetical protein
MKTGLGFKNPIISFLKTLNTVPHGCSALEEQRYNSSSSYPPFASLLSDLRTPPFPPLSRRYKNGPTQEHIFSKILFRNLFIDAPKVRILNGT